MLCREIMKSPVYAVRDSDTVQTAARIMRDADIGFVPVCQEQGDVVGILTDRDVATRICAEDARPSETLVSNIMTRRVISCRPEHSVTRAMALMRRHRLTRILIADRDRCPLGVLSLSDVAQYVRAAKVGRTLQTVAERKYAPERI